MLNRFSMQIRRDIWQNKGILVKTPITLSAVTLVALIGFVLYFSIFGYIYNNNGQVTVNSKGPVITSKTEVIFDSSNITEMESLTIIDVKFDQISNPKSVHHIEQGDQFVTFVSSNELPFAKVNLSFEAFILMMIVIFVHTSMQTDRQDRSILFWRSLPVSESFNVLTKIFVGVAILPIIYLLAAFVTLFGIVLVAYVTEWIHVSGEYYSLGTRVFVLIKLWGNMAGWISFSLLWALPIITWCLFCASSTYSLRFPIFMIPPLVIMFLERILFNSKHFFNGVYNYVHEGIEVVLNLKTQQPTEIDSTYLTVGLLLSAVFIIATISIRRWQID